MGAGDHVGDRFGLDFDDSAAVAAAFVLVKESDIRVQTDPTRWEAVTVGQAITPEPPTVPSPVPVPSVGR